MDKKCRKMTLLTSRVWQSVTETAVAEILPVLGRMRVMMHACMEGFFKSSFLGFKLTKDDRRIYCLSSLKVWWTLSEIHNEMVSPQSLNFDIFECFFHLFSLLFTIWANGRANWWCRTVPYFVVTQWAVVTKPMDTYMYLLRQIYFIFDF